jgi:hypothetical protein
MAKWTTTRKVFLAAAMAVAIQAQAAAPDEAALLGRLPPGSAIETRLDADIDGDGIADVAFVGGNDDARWLVVEIGRKDGGSEAAAIHHGLDHPLGPASLSLRKNVLLVEDLTGGTTATATTYRYRRDPATGRMRLIGLDAERYSRTFNHDSLKISWNLLTGDFEVIRSILNQRPAGRDNAAYRYTNPQRTIRKPEPVYLEDTPNPDDLIDAEVPPVDEDRD